MYKTSAEVQTTRKDLITVDMNRNKDKVQIYIREAVDCTVLDEAEISISTDTFMQVMYPIMQAKGYELVPPLEGF